MWGASSTPGPNAPLGKCDTTASTYDHVLSSRHFKGNLCGTSTQPKASAQAALSQWTAAGFPASKLLLGLPLYGYVSQSTKTALTGSLLPSSDMMLLESAENSTDVSKQNFLNGAHARNTQVHTTAANAANLQSWYGQQIPFSSIVSSGALVKQSGNYTGAGGFTMG